MSRKRITQFGCVLTALVVVGFLSATMHAQPAGKGSVSGRILTTEGQPASNFQLRLEQSIPLGASPRSTFGTSDATGLQRIRIIARGNTNQNGEFQFQNVDEGTYTLVGGSKQVGWVYYPVEIKPNEDTKLGDIQLVKTN